MRDIDHFIVGHAGGTATRHGDVFDPNSGSVQARVALGEQADLDRAIAAAQKAQPGWAATNPQRRARVMFRLRNWSRRTWTRSPTCSAPNTAR